jgi:hypothetical protein
MSKNSKPISLAQAFNALAEHLTDIVTVVNHETGEFEQKNNMAYAQRRVLNGIAYSAELTLKSTDTSMDKAKDKLRMLTRQANGTNQPEIDRQCEWIERLIMQQTVLGTVLEAAAAAHLEHTKEAYVPAAVQQRNRQLQAGMVKASPTMDRASKLLKTLGVDDAGRVETGIYNSEIHSNDPAEEVKVAYVKMRH